MTSKKAQEITQNLNVKKYDHCTDAELDSLTINLKRILEMTTDYDKSYTKEEAMAIQYARSLPAKTREKNRKSKKNS